MNAFTPADRVLFDRLVAESACRSLLERYSHCCDWMDWETMKTLWWPDAQLDFGMWAGDLDAFLPWVRTLEEGYERRLHLFCIQGIALDGNRARAEVGMTNHLRLVDETGTRQDDLLFGRYKFGLACRNGEWRLVSLKFLMHGAQRFAATDNGGSGFYADALDTSHPLFAS